MPVSIVDRETLINAIYENVEIGSTVITDEAVACKGINGVLFKHQSVNHFGGEYSRGIASTNGIESVWALLKRSLFGTWHRVSAKHLGRYVNEVAFRLKAGNVARHMLDSLIAGANGQRLTYARLIG